MGHNVSFPFSKDSIHNKTHTAHRNGAPCVFLNLYFLCNLLVFNQLFIGQIVSDKQNTGQTEHLIYKMKMGIKSEKKYQDFEIEYRIAV